MGLALLSKRDGRRVRLSRSREDQASLFDLDPQGIAFAKAGSDEPPAAEADHRDARPRIEVRGH